MSALLEKARSFGRTTTNTWWIIPFVPKVDASGVTVGWVPAIKAFRATLRLSQDRSRARFYMKGGTSPAFDPTKARYATSDMVTNITSDETDPVRLMGGQASALRLMSLHHGWEKEATASTIPFKSWLTLDQALKHKHLNADGVSYDQVVAGYQDAEIEVVEA